MLFIEQGIIITSILTAIGMAIGVLVEELLPSGGGAAVQAKPLPKGKKSAKEWLRNKLKSLAMLLERLGTKVAEVLPAILRAITSWILNRAKEVVGWVLQNLWALVIGVRGLLYMYMIMRKEHTK